MDVLEMLQLVDTFFKVLESSRGKMLRHEIWCVPVDVSGAAAAAISRLLILHRASGGMNTNGHDRAQHCCCCCCWWRYSDECERPPLCVHIAFDRPRPPTSSSPHQSAGSDSGLEERRKTGAACICVFNFCVFISYF